MSLDTPPKFDQDSYLSRKKYERWRAWFFSILGGAILLNSSFPIPIPLVGIPSIVLGGTALIYGLYQFRIYKELPIHDALLFGRSLKDNLTRTDLLLALKLSPERTDQLIHELIKHGFIEPANVELPSETDIHYRVIS